MNHFDVRSWHLRCSGTGAMIAKKGLMLVVLAVLLGGCSKAGSNESSLDLPLVASYESLNANVFAPKCLTCHEGAGAPHGVDLSSYESIVQSNLFPALVVPGDPENSSLYASVSEGRMPKGPAKLGRAEIEAIASWIRNGAPKVGTEPVSGPESDPEEEQGMVLNGYDLVYQ